MSKLSLCYACGENEADTMDHVPPKCFFPKNSGLKLMTVPCCTRCNFEFSKTDGELRAWFSLHYRASEVGKAIREEKVKSGTFLRNRKLARKIEATIHYEIKPNTGGMIILKQGIVEWEVMNPFLERCTKGITRLACPQLNLSKAEFNVFEIAPHTTYDAEIEVLRNRCRKSRKAGCDVFSFQGNLDTETLSNGVLVMMFYRAAIFGVRWRLPDQSN